MHDSEIAGGQDRYSSEVSTCTASVVIDSFIGNAGNRGFFGKMKTVRKGFDVRSTPWYAGKRGIVQ